MGRKNKRNKKKTGRAGRHSQEKLRAKRKSSQPGKKQPRGKKGVQKNKPQAKGRPESADQKLPVVVAGEMAEEKPVVTTFSSKLEEVIAQSEEKKKLFGGKVILLAAPANYLTRRWKSFCRHLRAGLKKFVIIMLVLLLLAAGLVGIEAFAHDRVFPRVALAGVDYGFYEISRARDHVEKSLREFETGALNFVFGEKSVEIPLAELSVQYDHQATLDALPYFRFRQYGTIDLLLAAAWGAELRPIFKKDDRHIFDLVERKLELNSARAQSAALLLDEEGVLTIIPEREGIVVDQADLQEQLAERLTTFDSAPLVLETLRELPEVTAADLEKQLPDLQLKLENRIEIKHAGKNWQFRPLDHLGQITFRKQNDQIVITMTPALIEEYFRGEVFGQVEKPVSHLKIFYDEQDKIIFEGKALNGDAVNVEKFINDLEMAVNSLDNEVELLVEEQRAEVEVDERLQTLGIRELIGTGHTAFAGSPSNRRHNIATGMAKFNGLLIPPGATFSFNDNLGEVDGSTGYKLELVIKAEGTVPEYGGGICQVSSTMFKAALFSGLPIVERSPHSYAVGYYAQVDGYGLDSTIYPGVKDLKFTNDTPAHMLIQTFVEGDQAYINFFGSSDGRQVRLENYWRGNYRGAGGTQLIPTTTLPPGARKQIESAHGGFDASWDRIIVRDGVETVEKIYSVYRATSNRILVGQE